MRVLITGAAGFIGFHLSRLFLDAGEEVVGIDSVNDYYPVSLKEARLRGLAKYKSFSFVKKDLADRDSVELVAAQRADVIVHLAAQAGVRYSMENPQAYVDSNLQAFLNVLEGARRAVPRHLLYASSSSVYGSDSAVPFNETATASAPESFYAATKRANELMACSYSHLYGIPCTGVRFFTVYGPWGRPDMAVYKFALAIQRNAPVPVFGDGSMQRDFTYIDDCVKALSILSQVPPNGTQLHRVVNIGNRHPESVNNLLDLLSKELGRAVERKSLPVPLGDVPLTYADTQLLAELTGFTPNTPIEKGLPAFCSWFREYHK